MGVEGVAGITSTNMALMGRRLLLIFHYSEHLQWESTLIQEDFSRDLQIAELFLGCFGFFLQFVPTKQS